MRRRTSGDGRDERGRPIHLSSDSVQLEVEENLLRENRRLIGGARVNISEMLVLSTTRNYVVYKQEMPECNIKSE